MLSDRFKNAQYADASDCSHGFDNLKPDSMQLIPRCPIRISGATCNSLHTLLFWVIYIAIVLLEDDISAGHKAVEPYFRLCRSRSSRVILSSSRRCIRHYPSYPIIIQVLSQTAVLSNVSLLLAAA